MSPEDVKAPAWSLMDGGSKETQMGVGKSESGMTGAESSLKRE